VASFDFRNLQASESVDWRAAGKVGAVKDQGDCGSCYSFSANTALEAAIAIAENTTPVHLSEQQVVDCSGAYGNQGCYGGYETQVWAYQRDNGAVLASDYPYKAVKGTCSAAGKTVEAKPSTYGRIPAGDVSQIVSRLQTAPIVLGVQAGQTNFMNYDSGIMTSDTCMGGEIDHGVALVGFNAGDGETTTEIHTVTETWCRYRSWRDNYYSSGCRYSDEFYWSGYCCWEETTTEEVVIPGGESYFLVQNSWGEWWGEQGFVRLAVEQGTYGPCSMNEDAMWVAGASV